MDKNAFAPTPPMGWNSYDYYDTTVNEAQVRANAEVLAQKLKPFGWEYVVIDIQWYAHRAGSMRDKFQYIPFAPVEMDPYSRLLPDPERYPSAAGGQGFKPLADYIHSLGLKFGIHMMRGIPRQAAHQHAKILGTDTTADMVAEPNSVCRWNPDMYGVRDCPEGQAYYDSVIELYASWGVDFIKCDDICNTDNLVNHSEKGYERRHEIEMLHRAILKSGREIVLSLSPGPAIIQKSWHYKKYANMWRITDDFWDNWQDLKEMFPRCEIWQDHIAPGCYPDCDMLPLGKIGGGFGRGEWDTHLTRDEQRTMMTLWCLFGSPLMLGAELTRLDAWTLSLLTNQKVLAMLPPACRPQQQCRDNAHAVWTAANEKTGQRWVALFNLADEEREVSARLEGDQALVELWTGETAHGENGTLRATVAPHGCKVYQVC
ncbi:glycoside hydrolase family 27 protein [Acutalibacter intestini]|uniref:glycoside hydrolase family 27 protein n=1 Tax=Acutalibacter intestini TaxID=3093659 RepID=UPI002AC9CABD|nr:glycoside hydrolase family 27 protein [Acutalibacter sp. M00204]